MMKKKLVGLLLIAGLFVSAACGNGGADTAAPADDGAAAGGGAEAPAAGADGPAPVELVFTFWGSPVERTAVESMMAAFTQVNPHITVDARHIPADYDVVIRTMIAGGEAPDAGYLGGQTALEWAADGVIVDLYQLIAADPHFHIDDFIAPCFYRTMDGQIVGFNSAMEKFALFYSIDIFEEEGLPRPPKRVQDAWHWYEMLDVARTLTRDANGNNAHDPAFDSDNVVRFGFNVGPWWGPWMNFVLSAGGDIISDCGNFFTLADSPAVDALQMVADLIHVHHVNPTPAQRAVVPAPAIALLTGQVAMTVDGQWVLLDLGEAAVEDGLNFGVGVLPYINEYRTTFIGGATVIFADSNYIEEAYELLKFTSSPSAYIGIFENGLWMPLLREWYTNDELFVQWAGPNNPARPYGYDTVFRDPLLMDGIVLPCLEYYLGNMHGVFNILNPALDRAWLGEVTMREALEDVRNDIESVMTGRWPGGVWLD